MAYLSKHLFPVLSQAINSFMIDAMRSKHFSDFARVHQFGSGQSNNQEAEAKDRSKQTSFKQYAFRSAENHSTPIQAPAASPLQT